MNSPSNSDKTDRRALLTFASNKTTTGEVLLLLAKQNFVKRVKFPFQAMSVPLKRSIDITFLSRTTREELAREATQRACYVKFRVVLTVEDSYQTCDMFPKPICRLCLTLLGSTSSVVECLKYLSVLFAQRKPVTIVDAFRFHHSKARFSSHPRVPSSRARSRCNSSFWWRLCP
jgi:hypothetical protein